MLLTSTQVNPAKLRKMSQAPNYGIDSPVIVLFELALGVVVLSCTAVFPRIFSLNLHWLELLAGIGFLSLAASMLLYSKSGKFGLLRRGPLQLRSA